MAKKAKKEVMIKTDEEEEEVIEEEEQDEEPEEDEDEAEKSVSAEDLMKAIGDYEAVEAALTEAGGDRESLLKAKLEDGVISRAEQIELGQLWAGLGDAKNDEQIHKSLTSSITADYPDAEQLFDASEFLDSLVKSLDSSLGEIRSELVRDGENTRNFLRAQGSLLKSVGRVIHHQDKLIKSQQTVIREMGHRLGVLEKEPVVRKSRGADPRDVRFRTGDLGRGDSSPAQISKAEVFEGLNQMAKSASAKGDEAAMDVIVHATSKFESTGQIAPHVLAAVRSQLGHSN